jgi:dimeric dUTPase (all-alpha-NTP-PPase superfamily)
VKNFLKKNSSTKQNLLKYAGSAMENEEGREATDRLQHMYQLQMNLGRRIGVDVNRLNEEDRITWVLNYARAMQQEIAELIDSVPWKWWAKYQALDMQNARVEVIDILHFLLALAQTLGMSADDIYEAY